MTNKEIASKFNLLGKVMELHGENPFKIRSYSNAYLTIRKLPEDLGRMSETELAEINGIGKAIAAKIRELFDTGQMVTLNKYLDITPQGIQEMLMIKGFGPKKVATIWKELGIETIGELLYACEENRLVTLKGFGLKTQAQLRDQLEYFIDSKGLSHYASVKPDADAILKTLKQLYPTANMVLVGEIARKLPIVNGIEILSDSSIELNALLGKIEGLEEVDGILKYQHHHLQVHTTSEDDFYKSSIILTSNEAFRKVFEGKNPGSASSEAGVFQSVGLNFIPAELREDEYWLEKEGNKEIPELISEEDILGVVHNHSVYSDGLNTVEEMAVECMKLGYQYLVMSDHSKSAFYANGLSVDRVFQQQAEIDALNQKYPDFRIFKSIESDILSDGSLDYDDEVLKSFDLVIASIHSNLKMDEEKATQRLLAAIENPYTRILGHPTGRLLLARKGYPIDHKRIIDACADHDVVIELNANPHRLDLDWTWIPYALERGVMISINPDAHSLKGINDIRWGVAAARKGGLSAKRCLNAKSLELFLRWIDSKS